MKLRILRSGLRAGPVLLTLLGAVSCGETLPRPDAPALLGTEPASPSANRRPFVSGTALPQSEVILFDNPECRGAPLGSVFTEEDGSFRVGLTVPPNTAVALHGLARNATGISQCSATALTYVHDGLPPQPPLLTRLDPLPPSAEPNPRVFGRAEAGVTVEVFKGVGCSGEVLGTATAEGGEFEIAVAAVANRSTEFFARASDAVGNVSDCSRGLAYLHDDVRPEPPVVNTVVPAGPANELSPVLFGSAEAHALVRLFSDPACVVPAGEPAYAAPTGLFAASVTVLEDSTSAFWAVAEDLAGNASACAELGVTYVNDSLPPLPPQPASTIPVTPASEREPLLVLLAEPETLVRVFADPGCEGDELARGASAAGQLGLLVPVAADRLTTLYASAEDAAGNRSACSAGLGYEHDGIAPEPPVFAGMSPMTPANERVPVLHGTAEAGAEVRVFTGHACDGPSLVTRAVDGTFSINVIAERNDRTRYRARAYDAAGNASRCSEPVEFVHDGLPPDTALAVVHHGEGDQPTAWGDLETLPAYWEGFVDATDIVSYEVNASSSPRCLGDVHPTVDAGTANALVFEGLALLEGERYHACVRAIDEAGNVSDWVASVGLGPDVSGPSVVEFSPVSSDDGVELDEAVSIRLSELVLASSVSGDALRVKRGSEVIDGELLVDADTVTFVPAAPFAPDTTYSVEVLPVIRDRAGNALQDGLTWTFDTRPWRWSAPVSLINPEEEDVRHLEAAFDSQGRGFLVTESDFGDGVHRVFARRRYWGGSTPPGTLQSDSQVPAGLARLALDAEGDAVIAWREERPLGHYVRARLFDGAADDWEGPAAMLAGPAEEIRAISVGRAAGRGVVAWIEAAGVELRVRASLYDAGSWEAAATLAVFTEDEADVSVSVAPDGSAALVAWFGGSDVGFVDVAIHGSVWSSTERLASIVGRGAWTALALAGGEGAFAFSDLSGAPELAHRRRSGGVWGPITSSGFDAPETAPQFAVVDGELSLLWAGADGVLKVNDAGVELLDVEQTSAVQASSTAVGPWFVASWTAGEPDRGHELRAVAERGARRSLASSPIPGSGDGMVKRPWPVFAGEEPLVFWRRADAASGRGEIVVARPE